MSLNRQETTYNEIIGISSGEIVVLTDTFRYQGDPLKGATGFTIEPLTQDMIDEMRDPENMKEIWQDLVHSGDTEEGLSGWCERVNEEYNDREGYAWSDDPSFRSEMDEAYEKLTEEQKEKLDNAFGKIGKDFVDWNSRSCGRCIPTKESSYSLLLRPDLLKEVQKYEGERER